MFGNFLIAHPLARDSAIKKKNVDIAGIKAKYLSEIIFLLRKVLIMQLMLLLLMIMDLLLLAISFLRWIPLVGGNELDLWN